MNNDDLKRDIINTIGNHIDEVCLISNPESFVEMDACVVHVAYDGQDRYFRVDLTEVSGDDYFKPYEPAKFVAMVLDAAHGQPELPDGERVTGTLAGTVTPAPLAPKGGPS